MTSRNKVCSVLSYGFNKDEPVLIDTNVWLMLYPPTAPVTSFSNQQEYSAALKKILETKTPIIVEPLILSEYINRYLRIEYSGGWKDQYREYKLFRKSNDFYTAGEAVIEEVEKILNLETVLKKCSLFEDALDLSFVLSETKSGNFDFNDGLLLETCRHNHWKFLTDDGDMPTEHVEILTANRRLLRR